MNDMLLIHDSLCPQFQTKREGNFEQDARFCQLFCPRDLVGTVQISSTYFLFLRLSHALPEYSVRLCKFRWMILLGSTSLFEESEDFMYNFDLSRFMQQGTGTFCSCLTFWSLG